MPTEQAMNNVICVDKLPALRTEIARLDAQRCCMRISDHRWKALKKRARKSQRPFVEALEGELKRYAFWIQAHF
jgi:hypothetical protein